MYIKRFKPAHLIAVRDWIAPYVTHGLPELGWVVIEEGAILAVGFFRMVEGNLMAVEGPYLKPDTPRAVHGGYALERRFMSEAMDRGVDLVRLKTYKP